MKVLIDGDKNSFYIYPKEMFKIVELVFLQPNRLFRSQFHELMSGRIKQSRLDALFE